jgi:SWI/SNF-related matrix-associated actin-dependent regulator 1 of chromatin subfamily A
MATVPHPEYRIRPTDDGKLALTFPRNYDVIDAVKEIPGRRWEPDAIRWVVPVNAIAAAQVRDLMRRYGFWATPDVLTALDQAITGGAAREADSRAADADYDVPGLGGTLLPYQRAGTRYAVNGRNVFIGDAPGLGKTMQAFGVIAATGATPAVVVCPPNVLTKWGREAAKWLPGKRVVTLRGQTPDAAQLVGADVVLLGYSVLAYWAATLVAMGPVLVCLDESHYIKNRKARRAVAAVALGNAPTVQYRLGLTGTATLNRPRELVEQLRFLHRLDDLGGWYAFATQYGGMVESYSRFKKYDFITPSPAKLAELNSRMRSEGMYVRREKADVLTELPDKRRVTLPVSLDAAGRRAYQSVEQDTGRTMAEQQRTLGADMFKGRNGTAHLAAINDLRQLAAKLKTPAVVEWATDFLATGEKLVIFAHHIAVQDAIYQALVKDGRKPEDGTPYTVARIKGAMSHTDRAAANDAFQNDPNCRAIVCSLEAAAEGIDLFAASDTLFVELPWTPGKLTQAEDRIHRIGQRNACTIWVAVAEGTVDEDMATQLEDKRNATDAVNTGSVEEDAAGPILKHLVKALVARWGKEG